MESIWLKSIEDVKNIEEKIHTLKPQLPHKGIVVFGSARTTSHQEDYQEVYKLICNLAKHFFIITGGGYGIMEASNKAAKDSSAFSIGLNIRLEREEFPNTFLDMEIHFEEFWLRKYFFDRIASAFIVCVGGFGTLDELFDVLVLMQTQKRPKRPIILYGKKFWEPLFYFFEHSLITHQCINKEEMNLMSLANSPEEVLQILL